MNKKQRIILISGLVILGIVGAILVGTFLRPKDQSEALTPITLNLTYIPNIQFAPIYAAIENGYFAEAGLNVSLSYGNEADLVALIGSGSQQFMIASGEQVLLSRAQGIPVVYVSQWYRDYPVGLVSLVNAEIFEPADLADKQIGIPGLYGASYIGFEALLGNAGLKDADLRLIPIGFTQAESLVTGKVDAVVGYVANEPIVLKSMGYDVNVMKVSDYLDLVGNGLVTSEALIRDNPKLVQAMVTGFLKGIAFTLSNPDETYELSKNYVENLASADKPTQTAILRASMDQWQADPLGFSKSTGWQNMQDLLLKIGLLSSPIDIDRAFTNEFIN